MWGSTGRRRMAASATMNTGPEVAIASPAGLSKELGRNRMRSRQNSGAMKLWDGVLAINQLLKPK